MEEVIAEVELTFKMYRSCTKIFVKDFPDFCHKLDVDCKIKTKRFWPFNDTIIITLYGPINDIELIENELANLLKLVF